MREFFLSVTGLILLCMSIVVACGNGSKKQVPTYVRLYLSAACFTNFDKDLHNPMFKEEKVAMWTDEVIVYHTAAQLKKQFRFKQHCIAYIEYE